MRGALLTSSARHCSTLTRTPRQAWPRIYYMPRCNACHCLGAAYAVAHSVSSSTGMRLAGLALGSSLGSPPQGTPLLHNAMAVLLTQRGPWCCAAVGPHPSTSCGHAPMQPATCLNHHCPTTPWTHTAPAYYISSSQQGSPGNGAHGSAHAPLPCCLPRRVNLLCAESSASIPNSCRFD